MHAIFFGFFRYGFVLVGLGLLTACGDDEKARMAHAQAEARNAVAAFELLQQVPADTPYVLAVSRPLPEKLGAALLYSAQQSLNAKAAYHAPVLQMDTGTESSPEQTLVRVLEALLDEMDGQLDEAHLIALGWKPYGRTLIYGLGLLPVAWFEILDAETLQATLERVERKADVAVEIRDLEGLPYRRWDLGSTVAIVALRDEFLLFSVLPKTAERELLPLILGKRKPAVSLASGGRFERFVVEQGFLGYGDGYVDWVRWLEMATGEGTGLNAQVWRWLGKKHADVSPACRAFFLTTVKKMPRIAFGLSEVNDTGYTLRLRWESTPEVGAWLARLAAPVPGLGRDDGEPLLALGVGIQLPELRKALTNMLNYFREQGQDCELVDTEALAQATASLSLLLNPMFSGIKGFDLRIEDWELDEATRETKRLDVRLLIESTDPQGVFALLSMFDTRLTQVQLSDDGRPVALPEQKAFASIWAASKNESLVFWAGPSEHVSTAIETSLNLEPLPQPPLLAVSYNLDKILQVRKPMFEATQAKAIGDVAQGQKLQDIYQSLEASANVYRGMKFQLFGTGKGLEMKIRIDLQNRAQRSR